jgi:5'-nucleotidase
MWSRREFLQRSAGAGATLLLPGWINASVLSGELTKLIILHTNDTHSRIEPFPDDGSRNAGLGGAARRAALIQKIRDENPHVLLFDSGDIFQGTPYFNFFGGELEIRLMSEMG